MAGYVVLAPEGIDLPNADAVLGDPNNEGTTTHYAYNTVVPLSKLIPGQYQWMIQKGLIGENFSDVGQNILHNSSFNVWQRGEPINSINADNTYIADRWYVKRSGLLDVSKATTTPLSGFSHYLKLENKTDGNFGISVLQAVETINTLPHVGGELTLSFFARANADTTASKNLYAKILYSTSANTKPTTSLGSVDFALAYGSWTQCIITETIPSNAQTVGIEIGSAPPGLNGLAINDGLHIAGVKLEPGPVATTFEHRDYGTDLAECQRYFQRWYHPPLTGVVNGTTSMSRMHMPLPVPLRATPTSTTLNGTLNVWNGSGVGTLSNTIGTNFCTSTVMEFDLNLSAGGYTQTQPVVMYQNGNSGWIDISADL